MKYLTIFAFAIIFSQNLLAKDDVIEKGFLAFKSGGASLGWPTFVKGGPMEGSKEILAQAAQFGQVETYYGKYVSHEYILEKNIGTKNKIVYLVLNLDEGPLFGSFYLFKKSDGSWVVPNFSFHTHAEKVWPANIYLGCTD